MLSKLKALGPGLLYAGAAVGVSHIVQSTRAGAEFGYVLIIGIILAHIFKYPFFELGPKYTQATGKNLLHAYSKLGNWALITVQVLTIATMFVIQAAVTIVTAGLALKITGLGGQISAATMSLILLLICYGISAIGRFSVLDKLMKVIMITLSITTLVAVVASSIHARQIVPGTAVDFSIVNPNHLVFLIAFLGWMPAPLDIAIWHSIWSEERIASEGKRDAKAGLFDFRVGFIGTAILGICFLALGAQIIYGSGVELEMGGLKYSQQFIDLFTTSIGEWSYTIIAIAAFTTMFSTSLTCLDAMPRVLTKIREARSSSADFQLSSHQYRLIWMAVLVAGAAVILFFFISNMGQMVDFATTFSFLTAPVLAWFGVMIVRKQMPKDFWPQWKYGIAYAGIAFLVVLSVIYITQLI